MEKKKEQTQDMKKKIVRKSVTFAEDLKLGQKVK